MSVIMFLGVIELLAIPVAIIYLGVMLAGFLEERREKRHREESRRDLEKLQQVVREVGQTCITVADNALNFTPSNAYLDENEQMRDLYRSSLPGKRQPAQLRRVK